MAYDKGILIPPPSPFIFAQISPPEAPPFPPGATPGQRSFGGRDGSIPGAAGARS